MSIKYLVTLFLFFIINVPSDVYANNEPCVRRDIPLSCNVVQHAAGIAMKDLRLSLQQGRRVDTSRQVIAEGNRICLVAFRWADISANTATIDSHWCLEQEGALDIRKGLSRTEISPVRRYIQGLRHNPDSWELFRRNILGSPQYFAATQSLIRGGVEYDLIRLLMLRKDAVFANQNHPDGSITAD